MTWLLVIGGVLLLGALLYWQLILAEGAYLGRRAVIWLYDASARIYDRVKSFDPGYEQWFLGLPLSRELALVNDPLVLDVATGTGRLPRTLFTQANFRGRLIGVDLSHRMLKQAVETTAAWRDRITYLWHGAGEMPFEDATFDAVACLEALEFMPDQDRVLQEMARVLRPGGVFLITNRIGANARWLPGRTSTTEAFVEKLRALPLEMIRPQPWQEDYDLIWAVKPGVPDGPPSLRRLAEILRCPHCGADVHPQKDNAGLVCENGHVLPRTDEGIVKLV